MRLLQLYNQYRSPFGGEETVVRRIAELAEKNGVETRLLMRSSRGLDSSIWGKSRAFFSGIYNPFARREIIHLVREFRPDVVHVHNLYPLFSPSVLGAIRSQGVPVVMTVHNHFHTCPKSDHLYDGRICTKCVGGHEYHCILQNCRKNLFESVGYSIRSAVARKFRLFTGNVTVTIALNDFARKRLLVSGFPLNRVVVLPNAVDCPENQAAVHHGEYVIFSGRLVPGKGGNVLIKAAQECPQVPVRFYGGGSELNTLRGDAPTNVTFRGQVDSNEISEAYRRARFLVIPSQLFEGCPLVILEAMSYGLPVIASRIGGLPELVDDGETGLLFEPGNSEELAKKMKALWSNPGLCRSMGDAGRKRIADDFNEREYWRRLKEIYESVMKKSG